MLSQLDFKFFGLETIKEQYLHDAEFKDVLQNSRDGRAWTKFVLNDGFVFHANKLCIPDGSVCLLLLQKAHGGGLMGHFSVKKTEDALVAHDEDIPITPPLSPAHIDDENVAAKKSNEIRIGPITRARAKLLEQQVNSLLTEPDVLFTKSFILPKSMHLCMIRFVDNTSIAQGGDASQQDEQDLMIKCAREEREAGAPEDHQNIKSTWESTRWRARTAFDVMYTSLRRATLMGCVPK
jgi:hypothetical protein